MAERPGCDAGGGGFGVIGSARSRSTLSAQQALLVAQGKVLFNYFAAADFLTEMKTRGIDDHPNSCRFMRVTQLMQPERLIDRGRLAHDIDDRLTASLVIFSAKEGFAAIFCASVNHEGGEFASRDDVIDHAEPMRLLALQTSAVNRNSWPCAGPSSQG